ncbi:disintegrin and metalloproteinase domain-containing protein 10-like [Centruroides vittatus]|uniref:disintegrin and metalloproteinase domain-containing protein 10-like n=1 Tax=Centruroides vittatus TaxID=120091 RepID=UPI0035103A53
MTIGEKMILLRSLACLIIATLTLVLYYVQQVRTGLVLNDFIRHFEPLYYDHHSLRDQRHRIRRSANMEFHLRFTAHNRLFKLRMKQDSSVFASDAVFESTRKGKFRYDMSKVLKGHLEDDEDSIVEGVLTSEGLFDGVIHTAYDDFYIEPSARYFLQPRDFHSVIYKHSDVMYRALNSTCFSHLQHTSSSYRRDYLQSAFSTSGFSNVYFHSEHSIDSVNKSKGKWRTRKRRNIEDNTIYWRDVDEMHYKDYDKYGDSEPYGVRSVQRTHWTEDRSDRHVVIDPRKTTCMLYLQADHLFYQKMGSEEACIETMTRHVQKVNSIYRATDFDQDGRSDNISFLIKRIKVHTMEALKDPDYRFPGNYGVEKFLELFSEEDYDAFCLAYMFTYRDFEGGTLGLAWTGDLKNAGGVCEKNGHYRGSLKSLNTGIVTLLNYGKYVPPIVSHVTLAHEIGHNFGSPHDPEDDNICTPGGDNGNYIMFARATSGDKRNNNRFSPCSLRNINAVLNTKARSLKGCFTEPQDAICGNEVVERGEECDCGWEEDCKEPCCFPMRSNPPRDKPPCHLRPNVVCSPSQGPCCTHECKIKVGEECRGDNGCRSASFCDGQGPHCPSSTNKPNKTVCNDEFVCYMGECTGSICMAYGLESCQCKRSLHDPLTKACELCCKLPGNDHSCKSSFEWNSSPFDVPDLYAKPGTPCDNYNGYCDVFQKCREVDPSGPLATLRKLLLSTESIASLKRWVLDHWWGVILLFICVIIVLIIIVKAFGKRTEEGKMLSDPDHISEKNKTVFRSNTNHAVAKAHAQTVASNHSIAAALAHTACKQRTTSNFVKTSVSFRKHDQPLSMSGAGWV